MLGWALPWRSGSAPVTSAFWATLTRPASPAVEQRHLDAPALAAAQRRRDRRRGVEAGQHVHQRHADLVGRAVLGAGDRHQAGLGLGHEVVAGPAGRLAPRAEAGDRAVDDASGCAPAPARSPPPAGRRRPTLKFSITASARAHSSSASARPSSCERSSAQRALAAVDRQVVGRLAAGEGRPPGARLVAALRALDLDHVRAEVGEHHRAVGPGEHAREVDHADA